MVPWPEGGQAPEPCAGDSGQGQSVSTPEVPDHRDGGGALFVLGNVIAFFDDENRSTFWLADVVQLDGDTSATVHIRGTRGSNIKNARFLPVHVEAPSGLSILAAKMSKHLLSPGCTATPWTGSVSSEDVINFDVRLTSQHRLTAGARKALKNFKHMIMQ